MGWLALACIIAGALLHHKGKKENGAMLEIIGTMVLVLGILLLSYMVWLLVIA